MTDLVIGISWEYFLGIMGSLIALAYYANGRFTGIETDVGWLKETIAELVINAENVRTKLFQNGSPVSLTAAGYHTLQRSGLKSYIDAKKQPLLRALKLGTTSDTYELQRRTFRLLAELPLEDVVAQHLNSFAFNHGIDPSLLRRIGAIYLRDLATSAG
jgi:hypothetical protein